MIDKSCRPVRVTVTWSYQEKKRRWRKNPPEGHPDCFAAELFRPISPDMSLSSALVPTQQYSASAFLGGGTGILGMQPIGMMGGLGHGAQGQGLGNNVALEAAVGLHSALLHCHLLNPLSHVAPILMLPCFPVPATSMLSANADHGLDLHVLPHAPFLVPARCIVHSSKV